MKIAYINSDRTGAVNTALSELAKYLLDRGVRVVGTTQTDTPRQDGHKCDMDVKVLPDGDVIRISQDLGLNSRGCRLDPDALEQAVAQTLARLDTAELLIVNKFGKHEADGRGFREVIGAALARGIPVVVGTNGLNLAAFQEFSAGQAVGLPADVPELLNWLEGFRAVA